MKPYYLFDLENFPTAEKFTTHPQFESIETQLTTEFRREGVVAGFELYRVAHMRRVRLRGQPYSHQKQLDEVSELTRFDGFLHPSKDLLVLSSPRRECREAAKRLRYLETKTVATPVELDLKLFAEECTTIFSSHFRKVQEPFINASALYGPNVDKHELYGRFQTVGLQSALTTQHIHEGEAHQVMVTSGGGVIFVRPGAIATELGVLRGLRPILDNCRVKREGVPADEPGDEEDEGLNGILNLL